MTRHADLRIIPSLGRAVRSESVDLLGIPTPTLAVGAALDGQWSEAADLGRYFVRSELLRILSTYSTWIMESLRAIQGQFPETTTQELVAATLMPWSSLAGANPAAANGESQASAINGAVIQAAPNGSTGVHPFVVQLLRAESVAREVIAGQRQLRQSVYARDADVMADAFERLTKAGRALHDEMCDWIWALATYVQGRCGETELEWFFRTTTTSWIASRATYRQLAQMSPTEQMRLTAEGMRAHFSGPDRDGTIAIVEEKDRFIVVADPAASCERMRRGDATAPSSPRTEAPYDFSVVAGEYPWTWSRAGVSSYCVHCALVNEIMPIEQMGVPKRFTEYPDSARDPCLWLIYKNWLVAPEVYWERIGMRRNV